MTPTQRTPIRFQNVVAAAVALLSFAFLFSVHPAFAETAQEQLKQVGDAAGNILPQTELLRIVENVIRIFLGFLGIVLVLIVMYAGSLYMTSGGDATKTLKARKIIYQGVIGLFIILSSYAIVTFVFNFLLGGGNSQIVNKAPVEKYYEPLTGALGAGIIESHYPIRNATGVPRNTLIFVTFKQPIDPSTIIKNFDPNKAEGATDQSKLLNNGNVWIFETAIGGLSGKFAPEKVNVTVNDDHTMFVFDPVDYLGNDKKETNITVALQPGIKKDDATHSDAFTGTEKNGYGWTFTVSTELDLTPPKVVSVFPPNITPAQDYAPNATVEMTFNEAMNPVSSTGSYVVTNPQSKPLFTNVTVVDDSTNPVNEQGKFEISNGYRTIGFTTNNVCGKDPCGDAIFCLAPDQKPIKVTAHAATVDTANAPQAALLSGSFDGLTDAAGNSLDGNADGKACGSIGTETCPKDNYQWSFNTTKDIDVTVPKIESITPGINDQNIDQNKPIELQFNITLKSTTVNSTNVSLWPDPLYSMWFTTGHLDTNALGGTPAKSKVQINHPPFISNASGGHDYYPVVTHGLKSNYQICMYPSMMEATGCSSSSNTGTPYCCNGIPSADPCTTQSPAPNNVLPGNK